MYEETKKKEKRSSILAESRATALVLAMQHLKGAKPHPVRCVCVWGGGVAQKFADVQQNHQASWLWRLCSRIRHHVPYCICLPGG